MYSEYNNKIKNALYVWEGKIKCVSLEIQQI